MERNKNISRLIRTLGFTVLIVLLLIVTYPKSITHNEQIELIKSYFMTLSLTGAGALIGITFGGLLAYLRFQRVKVVECIVDEYIDVMRGTPLMIQLLIFTLWIFQGWKNTFLVASIAFGFNSAAYVAEIIRSGIESLDTGQMEAAKAIGMPYRLAMKEIILPQAIKNILPSLVNEFIVLFKETSIVGLISLMDLTFASKSLVSTYFDPLPIFFAGVIYYISVKVFSYLAKLLEGKLKEND